MFREFCTGVVRREGCTRGWGHVSVVLNRHTFTVTEKPAGGLASCVFQHSPFPKSLDYSALLSMSTLKMERINSHLFDLYEILLAGIC